jgi:hypothetical protein
MQTGLNWLSKGGLVFEGEYIFTSLVLYHLFKVVCDIVNVVGFCS